jgi:preprotein translocase subunit SecF
MSKKKQVALHKHAPKEKAPKRTGKSFPEKAKDFYIAEYKKLFIVIIALTLIASAGIFFTVMQTGEFTRRDVTLMGGVSLTVGTPYDTRDLESFLSAAFPQGSINVRSIETGGAISGIIVEASDIDEDELIAAVQERTGVTDRQEINVESMGSALGDSFFRQMFVALMIAFLCMGIVFHIYFRNLYATSAALLSAFLNLFITLGIMNIGGMRLTAGGIAAYLMLIGYSIDTSILLSTKMLKDRKDDLRKTIFRAMKTGLTMSFTGIAAIGISYLFTNNVVLKQIMLILLVGLVIDIFTTWIGNLTFLRLYLERHKNVKN